VIQILRQRNVSLRHSTRILCQTALLILAFSNMLPASAACFTQAAEYYDLPEILLRAIVQYESGGNENAVHVNKDGSRDIGLMQINERWLPTLKRQGISEADLWDGCVNLFVGAWILSRNYMRTQDIWQAVGAYNGGFRVSPARDARRTRYIAMIQATVKKLKASGDS